MRNCRYTLLGPYYGRIHRRKAGEIGGGFGIWEEALLILHPAVGNSSPSMSTYLTARSGGHGIIRA
jgi:hypothetical protein